MPGLFLTFEHETQIKSILARSGAEPMHVRKFYILVLDMPYPKEGSRGEEAIAEQKFCELSQRDEGRREG